MARRAFSLSVDTGALITLLGPSGCGKTTLLRLIAGLATPDEGSVSIAGVDVTWTPPHKRNVSVVFQSYALFPHLTVGGNVGFGLQRRGLPRDTVAAKVELRRLLKRIGATAVFVTHDQDEALTMSDRVAVMNAGRIEHFADPLALYARPRTLFTMRFVGTSSELRGTVAAREGARLRVDTPQGRILAEGTHPVGARVVVATRPEYIEINTMVGPDDSRIDGRIRQITFQGSRTRVAVDVGSEADFMVELRGVNEPPARGEEVSLHWVAARSLAFLDASAAS